MADHRISHLCPNCKQERLIRRRDLLKSPTGGLCQPCCRLLRGPRTTHGQRSASEYHRWVAMKQRCLNKNDSEYARYGGRGISIAPEFMTFEGFIAYMGPCPEGLSLDRIDNEGNYEPGNVRWASYTTQARNQRSNFMLTLNGETHCVTEWAEILHISRTTLWYRIHNGWSTERLLTQPLRRIS